MRPNRALFSFIAITMALLFCWGCAPRTQHLSLVDSVRIFNDSLRWNNYQKASAFVVPMDKANFMKEQANLSETRRIMEFRVVEISPVDEKTAKAIVQWKYTTQNSPVVIKERLAQVWTHVGDDWFLLRMKPVEKEKKETQPEPSRAAPQ